MMLFQFQTATKKNPATAAAKIYFTYLSSIFYMDPGLFLLLLHVCEFSLHLIIYGLRQTVKLKLLVLSLVQAG